MRNTCSDMGKYWRQHSAYCAHIRVTCGYTLIEILVVMLIMGIFATLGTPHFVRWLTVYRLRAATTVMMNHFRATRLLAIHTGVKHQIQIRGADDGNYYQVVRDPKGPTESIVNTIGRVPVGKRFGGVRLAQSPKLITFTPRGTSHNRTIILENDAGMRVKIVTSNGRVRSQYLF